MNILLSQKNDEKTVDIMDKSVIYIIVWYPFSVYIEHAFMQNCKDIDQTPII